MSTVRSFSERNVIHVNGPILFWKKCHSCQRSDLFSERNVIYVNGPIFFWKKFHSCQRFDLFLKEMSFMSTVLIFFLKEMSKRISSSFCARGWCWFDQFGLLSQIDHNFWWAKYILKIATFQMLIQFFVKKKSISSSKAIS